MQFVANWTQQGVKVHANIGNKKREIRITFMSFLLVTALQGSRWFSNCTLNKAFVKSHNEKKRSRKVKL